MMKIGIITATFPPYFGGTGNVAYNHAVGLAKLGHKITVFTPDFGDYNYPKEINVKRLKPLFKLGNAPFLPGLLKIKRNDFDILHLHAPFFFGSEMVWLLSNIRKIPYVMNYQMDVSLQGFLKWPVKAYNNTLLKLILKDARKVIVSSFDYAQHSIVKNCKNLVEIPNGVDIERFNPGLDGTIIRKKHGLNGKVVLFVGALDKAHYFKGVDVLLESFKDINATLLIVGEGGLKESYIKTAERLGIKDKAIFAGRVSDDELPLYYAASDLLVLPSTTAGEAFGLVLLEAMACGKPVITSNLPGVRKTAEGCGLIVNPADPIDLNTKIKIFFEDKEIAGKVGNFGKIKVEKEYNWQVIIQSLGGLYEKVCC